MNSIIMIIFLLFKKTHVKVIPKVVIMLINLQRTVGMKGYK